MSFMSLYEPKFCFKSEIRIRKFSLPDWGSSVKIPLNSECLTHRIYRDVSIAESVTLSDNNIGKTLKIFWRFSNFIFYLVLIKLDESKVNY